MAKVNIFSPFYAPSSDLHTRTNERKYAITYITLEKDISFFTQIYKTVGNAYDY
jgi:hypothetical protein